MQNANAVGLDNLEALSTETSSRTLGYLVWYTIVEVEIPKEQLEYLLKQYDLWEYMLKPISPNDAFRRAAKSIEKNNVATFYEGVTQNHLVSGFDTKEEIVRHLVVETIDSNNQSLHYDPEKAIIKYEKETGNITYSSKTEKATELAESVISAYPRCLNNYSSRNIRQLITNILHDMAPIAVRPSGGVYFIPKKYETKLSNMLSFLKNIGQSEGYKVPLVKNSENSDMIRLKLNEHIRGQIQQAADYLRSGSDSCAEGKKNLSSIRKLILDFKDYQDVCSLSFKEMNEMTEILQKQASRIIDRVTEIKEKG